MCYTKDCVKNMHQIELDIFLVITDNSRGEKGVFEALPGLFTSVLVE